MAYCCYECGKVIRGQMRLITPPLYVMRLTGDFAKAYHPKCYEKAEEAAYQELHGKPWDEVRGGYTGLGG